jgi:hypothetical protein
LAHCISPNGLFKSQNLKYVFFSFLAWISDRNEDGFSLTYPSIGVYGVSAPDAQHPEPNLFMVVDLNKTSKEL